MTLEFSSATRIASTDARARRRVSFLRLPRRFFNGCDDSAGGERRLEYAVSALDWCRRLPKLADMLPAAVWQELLNHLVQSAAEAETAGRRREPLGGRSAGPSTPGRRVGADAWPACFPRSRPVAGSCRRRVGRCRPGLADLLDGEGLPHARHFDQLRPLLACWTRCRALGNRRKRGCWSAEADAQYRQFVRNALAADPPRRLAGVFASDVRPIRRATVRRSLCGCRGDGRRRGTIARLRRDRVAGQDKKKRRKRNGRRTLPTAAIHSEWAATAVLRPDWSRSAPRLTVLYPGKSCRVELACGKDVLWSGDWGFDVRIDGMPASPVSEWSETCWVSDEDVDYLELEIELGEGFRLQRHIRHGAKGSVPVAGRRGVGAAAGRSRLSRHAAAWPADHVPAGERDQRGRAGRAESLERWRFRWPCPSGVRTSPLRGQCASATAWNEQCSTWTAERHCLFQQCAMADSVGTAAIGLRTFAVRAAVLRSRSAAFRQAADVAAAYRGRIAGGSAGRRGGGLSRCRRRQALADLPLADACRGIARCWATISRARRSWPDSRAKARSGR